METDSDQVLQVLLERQRNLEREIEIIKEALGKLMSQRTFDCPEFHKSLSLQLEVINTSILKRKRNVLLLDSWKSSRIRAFLVGQVRKNPKLYMFLIKMRRKLSRIQ